MSPSIKIVFQNKDFVIVIKEPGFLSVPSRMGVNDPRPVLGIALQDLLKQQVFPVHRLDEDVRGLMLFALTAPAHRVANQWFEQKKIQKIYLALSEGSAQDLQVGQKFEWRGKLMRGKKRAYFHEAGKDSLTHAEFLGMKGEFLSWQLEPVTGRSHQLRFDLFSRGWPIWRDTLYGSIKSGDEEGIALTAAKIIFPADAKEWGLPPTIQISDTPISEL